MIAPTPDLIAAAIRSPGGPAKAALEAEPVLLTPGAIVFSDVVTFVDLDVIDGALTIEQAELGLAMLAELPLDQRRVPVTAGLWLWWHRQMIANPDGIYVFFAANARVPIMTTEPALAEKANQWCATRLIR